MRSQDSVLGSQVLILLEQPMIYQSRYILRVDAPSEVLSSQPSIIPESSEIKRFEYFYLTGSPRVKIGRDWPVKRVIQP